MKIKFLVSDYDGTFIKDDMSMDERTVQAVARFRQAGGIFTISTGRMFASIRQFLGAAGIGDCNIPVASCQGLMVSESLTGKPLYITDMDREVALEIITEMEQKGIYTQVYVVDEDGVDRLYVKEDSEFARMYAKYVSVDFHVVGKLSSFVASLGTKRKLLKVLMFVEQDNMMEYISHYDQKYKGRAFFTSSTKGMLEAIDIHGGKEKALEYMADYLGVPLESTAACGDGLNDLQMIKLAGLGCAVGNACKELKEAADLVLPTNEQNAVGVLIDKILANEV